VSPEVAQGTPEKSLAGSRAVNPAVSRTPSFPITAVGDSVILGARKALKDTFDRITIDATISRLPVEVAERVRERVDVDRMGDVLIVQTGTNGPPDSEGFRNFLASLDDLDLVVVMTVRSEVPWMEQSNAIIERAASGAKNVVVADWAQATVGHPQYLYKDGTHLTVRGQQAYARLIVDAMKEADAKGVGNDE
jgi:hypothetical protein